MPPASARCADSLPPLRQGPRPVRASATTGCCSSRRTGLSAFDVVLPTPIPDKGRVLTGLSRFWFARDRPDRRRTTSLGVAPEDIPVRRPAPTRRRRRAARPDDALPPRRVVPIEVDRPRLPRGLGLEGLPAGRARSAASRCRPGLRESDRLPEPIFTPVDEGRGRRARREHHVRRRWPPTASARDVAGAGRATLAIAPVPAAAPTIAEPAGVILLPTRSSSSGSTRRPASCSSSTRS